jgi:hypothetical protein
LEEEKARRQVEKEEKLRGREGFTAVNFDISLGRTVFVKKKLVLCRG